MWVSGADACSHLCISAGRLRRRRMKGDIENRRLDNGRYEYRLEQPSPQRLLEPQWRLLEPQWRLLEPQWRLFEPQWRALLASAAGPPSDGTAGDLPLADELGIRPRAALAQCARLLTGAFVDVEMTDAVASFAMLHAPTALCRALLGFDAFGFNNALALLFACGQRFDLRSGMAPAALLHVWACVTFTTVLHLAAVCAGLQRHAAMAGATLYSSACLFQLLLRHKTKGLRVGRTVAHVVAFAAAANAPLFLMRN
jgi:hypothetical protein